MANKKINGVRPEPEVDSRGNIALSTYIPKELHARLEKHVEETKTMKWGIITLALEDWLKRHK